MGCIDIFVLYTILLLLSMEVINMSKKSFYAGILLILFSLHVPVQAGISLGSIFSTIKEYVLEKKGWHDVGLLACAIAGLAWCGTRYYKSTQKHSPKNYSKNQYCSECSNYQSTYLNNLQQAPIKWERYSNYIQDKNVNIIGKLFCDNKEILYELDTHRTFISLKPHLTDKKFVVLTKYQDEYYISQFYIDEQELYTGKKTANLIIKLSESHDLARFNKVALSYFTYLAEDYVCMLWCNEDNDLKIIACKITNPNQPKVEDITHLPKTAPFLEGFLSEEDELAFVKEHISKYVFSIPSKQPQKYYQNFGWCPLL